MLEKEFPILKRRINGHALVYLDNASTTQKPESVLRAMDQFYRLHNANTHRGIHTLSQEATALYESARDKVRKFVNAGSREEIIFTSNATESVNLVVWTWGHENVHRGDEILLSEAEHHSNLVPWQLLAKKKGARLRFIPIKNGRLDLKNLNKLINRRTKIVAINHISNVLGAINPIEKIIKSAHSKKALVLIDGAQAGGHIPIDVRKLDCDFYVLSSHKMYGPTGAGVLYGKKVLLESMPPYQSGGHMIKTVDLKSATWADLPQKFEAGTANIAEVVGLGAAIDYVNRAGLKKITSHERGLTDYTLKKMKQIPGITIYGPGSPIERIGVITFNLKGVPPHDLASILDSKGIAIRTGHHCAMPLHDLLRIESSARVSFAIYNSKQDIDKFIAATKYAAKLLR